MRSAILLLCIFTATSADISLISLGTKNAADDGYIYNRPSIPFDLPQKEIIIKPNPGSSGPVISVTPRTKYNYPTPSSPFKPNEVPNASKQSRITNTEQVIITPRPVQTAKTTYNHPTPSIPFEKSSNGYKYDAPKSGFEDGFNNIDIITPPTVITPRPQLKYPNSAQEQIFKASQQIKIPVSTRPTTTTAKPTPKIIQSTYLPPEVTRPASTTTTTTTRRPTTARLIDVTKEGYTYEKPAIPFESVDHKLRIDPPTPRPITTQKPVPSLYLPPSSTPVTTPRTTTTQKPIQSTYLPPEVSRPTITTTSTTGRPTTARIIDVTKDGYTYEKPAITFESVNNKLRVDPPTSTPITTQKPLQSTYLPPEVTRPATTSTTTRRPTVTTQKPIQSSYLPPEVIITTTRRPTTARIIDLTKDGYTYEKPAIPFESVNNKLMVDPPTSRPITASRTQKPIQSTYLPPEITRPATTSTTTRHPTPTTQKPIQSSYLPPQVTTSTTRRPTTARIIDVTKEGYTYEKPAIPFESVNNKLRVHAPTPRPITTPKTVPSVYLPPSSTPVTTPRTTTTQKPIQSTYLPPEVSRPTITTTTSTTRRPTTARIIDVTKDGYTYEKPAIPFESVINKLRVDPPTSIPITTQKPLQSTYLPPEVTRPATTSTTTRRPTPTTQKPIQSSYLPPEVITTTTRRPTTARIIDVTKDGYTYEKPAIPFESVNNKLRVDPPTSRPITTSRTQKPIQSTYLPPEITRPATTSTTTRHPTPTTQKPLQSSYLPPQVTTSTTRRPTTTRIIDVTKEGYTYEKPAIPFESVNNRLRVHPPTPRPITTPKPVPSLYLPPSSTPVTTPRTTTTQKPIQSTYLPPVVSRQPPIITTIRPAKPSILSRGGYKFENTIVSTEDVSTIIRRNISLSDTNTVRGGYKFEKPNPLPSTYLPPSDNPTTRPTTARPTTARPTTARPTTARPTTAPTARSVASTYLPPNEKQQQPKINLNIQKPTIITTLRPVITSTPKLIASTYLPPNEKPEQSKANLKIQIPTTKLTTVRTTSKSISSTYLPPSEKTTVRQQQTTRATVKPSPKSVASTYLPPNDKVEQSKTNLKFESPTTRVTTIQTTPKSVPSTYLPPTVGSTPKFIASTYIPPNEKGEQSKTNLRTQSPTTRLTTVRTTPKSIRSTYLPPSETVTQQQTTRATTTRATVRPSLKSVASTYLPPNEKAEQSKTNLKLQPSSTRATTTTARSVPSTYLPPKEKPTIKVQPTTTATVKPTQKSLASTYLPPNEKSEQSRSNLKFQNPSTTTVRTTVKSVPSTYLPPVATNGYHYPKPAIPFTF